MLLKDLSALSSPLNDQQIIQAQKLVEDLSSVQLAWISGYFWGISQSPEKGESASQPVLKHAPKKLCIIYASQTGNVKELAKSLQNKSKAQGFDVSLFSAEEYKPRQLSNESYVIILTATHGEGEPPDDALSLHEFLQSKKASRLDKLNYAVLGLGDSSYAYFCQTAKDFDGFLENLGAKAILPRLDCDVDYEHKAQTWCNSLLLELSADLNEPERDVVVPLHIKKLDSPSTYNKKNPFHANLIESQKITGRDSSKDVRHVEIDLSGSGLTYTPGDALGVYYQNDPLLVDEILKEVGLTGDEMIESDEASLSLRKALTDKYCITASNPQQVLAYANMSQCEKLLTLSKEKELLRNYANNTPFIALLNEKKMPLSPSKLTGLLRKMTPRFYSIASSQKEVGEEAHLTVGLLAFQKDSHWRYGGASNFLSRGLSEGESLRVFIDKNANFRLPEEDTAPLIMIGPGTGIAPFRAFMQEREARDAKGKNWLFFGDRTFSQDFLYQVEWQKYLKEGLLTRIDLAFSRDQAEKKYVQHRIIEQGETLWAWLQEGAYIYVCGDRTHMAKDVNEAFITLVKKHGKKTREEAEEYLRELRKAKRYQKDVY